MILAIERNCSGAAMKRGVTRTSGDYSSARQMADGRSDATITSCFSVTHFLRALASSAAEKKMLGSGCGRKNDLHIFLPEPYCFGNVNGSLGVAAGCVERNRFGIGRLGVWCLSTPLRGLGQ